MDLIKAGSVAFAPPPEAKTPADKQAALVAAIRSILSNTLLLPSGIFCSSAEASTWCWFQGTTRRKATYSAL